MLAYFSRNLNLSNDIIEDKELISFHNKNFLETKDVSVIIVMREEISSSFLKYVKYLTKYIKKISSLDLKIAEFANLENIVANHRAKDKTSIIHIPFLGRGAFPSIKSLIKLRRHGFRIVVTLHGFDSCVLRSYCRRRLIPCPYEYNSIRQIFVDTKNKLLWHIFGRLVDYIITPSNSEKENLVQCLKIPRTKIYVIYHGVDHKLYRPYTLGEHHEFLIEKYGVSNDFILHVSSYQPKKNVERIIAAYALLKKKYNINERLVIIGRHPMRRLLNFALGLGLDSKSVIFTGIIPEKYLPYFYGAAKVFIFPSLHESFGMPIVEAMACGCPVVTSNLFACPEVSRGAALHVDPYNTKEIATAILRVIKDEVLRKELTRKGLKRAKYFTWEKTALEHLKVYKTIAGL